jgi:hypothetical protein
MPCSTGGIHRNLLPMSEGVDSSDKLVSTSSITLHINP